MVVLRTDFFKCGFSVICSYVHQWLTGGVLYEMLGIVGSYDLEKCVLLLLICSYNFVVLKIKSDYSVGGVTVVRL